MFSSLPVFFIFFTHVLVFILLFLSLLCHCFKVMICMYVCYMLFNKYSSSSTNYLHLLSVASALLLVCIFLMMILTMLMRNSALICSTSRSTRRRELGTNIGWAGFRAFATQPRSQRKAVLGWAWMRIGLHLDFGHGNRTRRMSAAKWPNFIKYVNGI